MSSHHHGEPGAPPTSGYRVLKIYAIEQKHELIDPEGHNFPEDRALKFSWDWRLLSDGEFEVLFGLEASPSRAIWERIRVTMVARFGHAATSPTVPIQDFVRAPAMAFLFPYVREAVSSLSSRGPFGTFIVAPMNVVQLAEQLSDERVTALAQLRENPSLGASYGISAEGLAQSR